MIFRKNKNEKLVKFSNCQTRCFAWFSDFRAGFGSVGCFTKFASQNISSFKRIKVTGMETDSINLLLGSLDWVFGSCCQGNSFHFTLTNFISNLNCKNCSLFWGTDEYCEKWMEKFSHSTFIFKVLCKSDIK